MTIKELDAKLQPGARDPSSYEGNSWIPTGQADGIIFRSVKKKIVVKNGQMVEIGATLVGDKWVSPVNEEARDIQARAFCYLKRATEEERTESFGFTHRHGIISHLGGLVDILAKHFKSLRDCRDKGYSLNHWVSMTPIGRRMMEPDILAHLKVVEVEEGIFAILYDPENLIP